MTTVVDDRVNAFLLAALERIAALDNAGPANEAARTALNEAQRLRLFLEHEQTRQAHYVTEAVAALLELGELTDDHVRDFGIGQLTGDDTDLELTDLGKTVVRRLIDRRHLGITIRAAS